MQNKSSRRLIITLILLAAAVIGGILRLLAPEPSLARDLGSLLLVLWLPIIGNVIAWLVARAHSRKAAPPGFDPASPFVPSARIELTLLAPDVPAASRPVRAGLFICAIALGSEAFSALLKVPDGGEPVPEVPMELELQFLRPDLALPRLPPGTQALMLYGRVLLGRVTVMQHIADAGGR